MSGKVTDIEEKRKNKSKNRPKKRIKKKKNINIKLLIIVAVFGYFLIRAIPMALSSYIKTETVEKEVFIDNIKTKGIIVKDETVYDERSENIEFGKEEGQRVGSGEVIAVSRPENFKAQEEELTKLDEQIILYEELLNEYRWLKSLKKKEKTATEDYLEHLKEKLGLKDEERLNSIKSDIENGTDNSDKFFTEEIEQLKNSKAEAEKSLESGVKTYVAEVPGIVSSNIDGFESEISSDMLDNLDFSKYNGIKEKLTSKEKKKAVKGVKLVEGHQWHLIMDIDKSYGEGLEGKGSLEVEFAKAKITLPGKIEKVETEDRSLVVLEFNEGLHKLYDQRHVDVSLVKAKYSGLKVPSSAITEKDGNRGVYIKEVSGIVSFIPVRLLYKGEEHSIVNEEEQGLIEIEKDGEKEKVRALQVFDEVFKNSMLVRENQVIN